MNERELLENDFNMQEHVMASWWAIFIKFNNDPLVAEQHFTNITILSLGTAKLQRARLRRLITPTRSIAASVNYLYMCEFMNENENYARIVI